MGIVNNKNGIVFGATAIHLNHVEFFTEIWIVEGPASHGHGIKINYDHEIKTNI